MLREMETMYDGLRKKQRGQKRKLNKLLKLINQYSLEGNTNDTYEHFHVPCASDFIDSSKTRRSIKQKFCQIWLDKTQYFINNKPSNAVFCKVVCVVSSNCLWNSQIIIFYDEQYYNSFWNRDNKYQSWIKITNKSYKDSCRLNTNMNELGFIETINDEEYNYRNDLWFYGEV